MARHKAHHNAQRRNGSSMLNRVLFGCVNEMKIKSVGFSLALVLFVTLTSGCASITGSTKQNVSVQTMGQGGKEIRDAACELGNSKGTWIVTSPGSVTVTPSNDAMQVTCKRQGSEPGRASVVSATKGAMFGNIILGGGVGAIIDYSSGAAFEYPTLIQVEMGTFRTIEMPKTFAEQSSGSNLNTQTAVIQSDMAAQSSVATSESTAPTGQGEFNSGLPREASWYRTYVIPYPR